MPLRSERLKQLLAHRLGNRLVFFLLAIVIGALVGLATVALIWLIELVHRIGYGTADEDGLAAMIASLPAWQVILVPTLGGAVVGGLLRFMPGQRYHGIADVMEACALNSARMPVRSDLVAALAAGVSLGSGVPLGREGPAVHIGSSLSALVAEKLGLDHRHSLALLGCGAASAVAVSFSTPITAVIFALEVIVGYYTLWVFAPVVIAAMAGMMVREAFLGQGTLFDLPARELASMWELLSFALRGVVAALFARAQLGVIPLMTGFWERLALPRLMRPAAAGVLIGVAALAFPHVLGLGIEGTQTALEGGFGAGEYTGLFIVKWLVVCLALASGFAGGVFGPAVFLGAMLGGAFWSFLSLTGLPLS
ncbi:MAG: chloride channel protein, partial [Gammaproteobacteria bacterium]